MSARPQPIKLEELTLRDMRSGDLGEVLNIERNAQISPWSRLSFEESLTKSHICRVVEGRKQILAFHIICPVLDELHVLNLAVCAQYQGAGLGHVLMDDIVKLARQVSAKQIFLEVRAGNHVAASLYLKWQFKQVGLRKNYYRAASCKQRASGDVIEQREDALVLMRALGQSPCPTIA